MRRLLLIVLAGVAGCSTAPVADFLDLVAPGGPGRMPDRRNDVLPAPATRDRNDPFPPPEPRRNNEPPPLPPVPTGYAPPPPIEGDEGERPARLRARPARPD